MRHMPTMISSAAGKAWIEHHLARKDRVKHYVEQMQADRFWRGIKKSVVLNRTMTITRSSITDSEAKTAARGEPERKVRIIFHNGMPCQRQEP